MHAKKLHLALSICHFSCGVDIALDGDEDHKRSEEEEGFSLCGTGQYQALGCHTIRTRWDEGLVGNGK